MGKLKISQNFGGHGPEGPPPPAYMSELHPDLFRTLLFTPTYEIPITFKSFLITSPPTILGRCAFRLVTTDG